MAKRKEFDEQSAAKATGVKIVVNTPFVDKFDNETVYEPGQELEFDEERAKDVVYRGLAAYKFADDEGDNIKSTEDENEQNGEEK
jgi:hypothetical protein